MFTKVLVKELDHLKATFLDLKGQITATIQKNEIVESEYNKAKLINETEMMNLQKILFKQQKRMNDLEAEEADLCLKIRGLDLLISEWKSDSRDEADELLKRKNDNGEEERTALKRLKSLKSSIDKAKEELETEEVCMMEVEKKYENLKASRATVTQEKLNKVRKIFEEKFKKAEAKYNSKKEPLVYRVRCLEEDIRELENEIALKPKEEEALNRRYEALKKQLARAVMTRLLQESQLTIEAINKALIYFRENLKSVFDDEKLGVLLAKSNLHWISVRIRSRFGNDHSMASKVIETLKICDEILDTNQSQNSSLLNNNFWINGAKSIIYGALPELDHNLPPYHFDSCQSIDDYMMEGTPDKSDLCIDELFKFKCNVSNYCWFSETNADFHSGYKTTHRLLYLQVASLLNCEGAAGRFYDVNEAKMVLCRQILSEAKYLYKRSNLLPVRDLFLEQIALCGYEGFAEFGLKSWRNEIRSWQNAIGCFEQNILPVNCVMGSSLPPVKRTDFIVDGCHTHLTSVAIAALAFHFRLVFTQLKINS